MTKITLKNKNTKIEQTSRYRYPNDNLTYFSFTFLNFYLIGMVLKVYPFLQMVLRTTG